MKDLRSVYLNLASNLERFWTTWEDKRQAAVLLRNHAIETPHCHFCGADDQSELYDSRYNPKARICRLCAVDIAFQFKKYLAWDQGQAQETPACPAGEPEAGRSDPTGGSVAPMGWSPPSGPQAQPQVNVKYSF